MNHISSIFYLIMPNFTGHVASTNDYSPKASSYGLMGCMLWWIIGMTCLIYHTFYTSFTIERVERKHIEEMSRVKCFGIDVFSTLELQHGHISLLVMLFYHYGVYFPFLWSTYYIYAYYRIDHENIESSNFHIIHSLKPKGIVTCKVIDPFFNYEGCRVC